MVFFTCNACGESLKKNKVETHWRSVCRACEVLTCVDCHKDFVGDAYATHTKCISEEQKYNGKAFSNRTNTGNKGERKQQAWLDRLHELSSSSSLSSEVRSALNVILNFENVPRKKAKFINFARNCVRGVRPYVIEETWSLFESALKSKTNNVAQNGSSNGSNNNGTTVEEKDVINGHQSETVSKDDSTKDKESKENEDYEGNMENNESKKTSKKEQKGKKRKVGKIDDKDIEDDDNEVEERRGVPMFQGLKDKKKKRSHDDVEMEDSDRKAKKSKESDVKDVSEDKDTIQKDVKFDWESTMVELLSSKTTQSMKMVRLQKKMVDAYLASKSTHLSREQLMKKVEKKAKNNPKFKVNKDKVKLS